MHGAQQNDSGADTLRSCLQTAVAGDLITFDPAVFPPGTPQTILVDSQLPLIVVDNLTLMAAMPVSSWMAAT